MASPSAHKHWCHRCYRYWDECNQDDIMTGNKLCPTCEATLEEQKTEVPPKSDEDERKSKL